MALVKKPNFPKVEIVKKRRNGPISGMNHYVTINGVKMPYVKTISTNLDARGLSTVTITMYADISTRTERKPL